MQTRRQLERARADAQGSLQDSANVHMDLDSADVAAAEDSKTAPSTVGSQQTPTPSKTGANTRPTKRKRGSINSSSSPTNKKLDIPHAARLPRIVWVFDYEFKWWPGTITPYPPQDHIATVTRFGDISPKKITVDCCESRILPFGDKLKEPHQLVEPGSAYAQSFQLALSQANQAQVKDDDDLPSLDDIMSQIASPSMVSAVKNATRKKKKREDLTIPGELVLAWSDRFYYPGRIAAFNNKTNKYKIDYASGHSQSIERKKFFTRYEKEFQTCQYTSFEQLGALALPAITDNYEDKELESQVRKLYPVLYAIVAGTPDEGGRLQGFLQGGKVKRALAQRVGPGSFGREEYGLIGALLQSEFLPDLATTTRKLRPGVLSQVASPMKQDTDVTRGFSDQMRLHFVTDVLLPETVTRLTMQRQGIGYIEAEQSVMECKRDESKDTWWVEDILAARESFLDGRVFRILSSSHFAMDASARSLLLELMAKSKKGLSLAEQLCSQAREELDACQSHSDEIEKIYSKLCFVSGQIKVQITELQTDLSRVSSRMDHALSALRDKEVDAEIQKARQGDQSHHKPKARVLFDFLDEASLNRLQDESKEHMQRIVLITDRIRQLVVFFSNKRIEFKSYLSSAITLDESALYIAREKMHIQEQQTLTMADSLVSLANHYDQVAQVLTADIQPMQEEIDVLDSDTAEVLVIIEELEESLALVRATGEEIGVREHLYATAYQEAAVFFKRIEAMEPELIQLLEALRSAQGLEEDFDATEKLIAEINSLAIWYEEFHNSYGALTEEIVRRHQAHAIQQRFVREFVDQMGVNYADELHRRAVFSERHGKFLPVDLCPAFAIIIQGFKSYKNQTVIEPFSAQHNVIAIRFVLSDAYTNMGREERQALLHEGSGAATMSAYVEIIFDNSDNRFPTGKDELVMRRTIGLKKDEYSMDKKSATKTDVMNMLESAGFSRSNPYYIVPQGRITSLTNAKDHERLQLLKEVAGTRVYEQRRQESLKIISETDTKRKNIEELLTYIEQRLEELEEEKEELKLYQEHDRRRRCLEYTIYSRELKDVNEALEEMEEGHRQDLDGSNMQQKDFREKESRMAALEQEIKTQKHHIELLLAEKRQLDHELESQIKVKAQIELRIKDHEDNAEMSSDTKRRNIEELRSIELEIEAKELELTQVMPELQAREAEERQLRDELEQADLQRQTLYSKKGRSDQFKSKAQRDEWIRNEISEIQQSYHKQTAQATMTEKDLEGLRSQLKQVSDKIQAARNQESTRRSENESLLKELTAMKAERDQLTDRRKDLWREDAKMDSTLNNLREEHRKAERALGASMDKNTSAGLAAVARIAKSLNLDGVYGPLYELFDVEDQYDIAVNVTAGSSLFHVVVDNEVTATRVLEALNKEKAGRVTFMPLSRLNPTPSTYPEANDAIPMIKKLAFDPMYIKAFEQVFGRALICRTLEIAATYSRSFNLNGITLDGDRIDRKGALTGGFQDTRNSRLNSIKSIKSFNTKYQTALERCQMIKKEISALDQAITGLLNKIQLIDVRRKQLVDQRETLAIELRSLIKDETMLKESSETKEKAHHNLTADLKILEAQLRALEDELESDMVETLTEAEDQLLGELVQKSDNMKERLSALASMRSKIGTRKNILEITLGSNLRPRLDELRDKVENGAVLDDDALQKRRDDLASIIRAVQEITGRIQEIEEELEDTNKSVADNESKLEKLQADLQEESRQMRKLQKDAEKYVSRRNLLLRKKDDCTKNIRELGVLPEEAFEKYKNAASEKLLKQIYKVNEELKKYSHVNKKAFEQYSNFTKQRDSLNERKGELDESEIAIRELIQTLDQRKDEAIERTFKQVAKNFSEVFLKLVPAGRGRLIMQRKMDQRTPDVDDEDEDQDGHEASAIDNYTGIAIQVSFNSRMDEGLRMQQLSGGQKSLVALTLIFAIQQCDPAPFYLFDEIDANLDAAHRTAVAAMIHSLSEQAQFITTTFRPEMLANADKFYGVTFQNKLSAVNAITKVEALEFVEQEQAR
ncbi:Structural maintenance of chromosomes protein 3 [Mortierella claussenii]|nr:Structural maintenance of chromosomes protein 3 [Mortierella claussenii]